MTAPSQVGRPWVDYDQIEGAYSGQLNALATKVAETYDEETQSTARLGSTRESLALAEEYDALYEEAKRVKRLMALPRKRWAAVKAEHPARKDDAGKTHEDDDAYRVDASSFFDAVLPETIIDPESDVHDPTPLFTEAECADFTDALSAGDWNALCMAVWVLNERGVGVPKSSVASRLRQRIEKDSEPRESSGYPRPASVAGNRLGSAPTTTSPET